MKATGRMMAAVGIAMGLLACSLLTPLDDLRGSASVDAGNDAALDAGADAADAADAPVSVEMACTPNGVPRLLTNDPLFEDRMAIHTLNGQLRVGVLRRAGGAFPAFYDVDGNLGNLKPLTTTAPPAGVQWQQMVAFEGGFLAFAVDPTAGPHLQAFFLPDASSTDSGLVTIDTTPALPGSLSDFAATAAPIDLATSTFFVAVTYRVAANDYAIHAGTVDFANTSSNTPLPVVAHVADRPSWDTPSILLDRAGKRAEVLNAPPQGIGDTIALATGLAGGDAGVRTLVVGAGAHVISAFAAPLSGGKNGFAFISGDPQNASIPLGMRAGLVDDGNATTFDPDTLPALIPFVLQDLPADRANTLWQTFGQEHHLVIAARALNSGAGINLAWIDGLGRLRGRLAGATALVPTENVRTAAAVLPTAPAALVADLVVGWITETNDLRIARVGCTAK